MVLPRISSGHHDADFRISTCWQNAEWLTADALQALMQHQDYKATQRSIEIAPQLKPAGQNLFVPDVQNLA